MPRMCSCDGAADGRHTCVEAAGSGVVPPTRSSRPLAAAPFSPPLPRAFAGPLHPQEAVAHGANPGATRAAQGLGHHARAGCMYPAGGVCAQIACGVCVCRLRAGCVCADCVRGVCVCVCARAQNLRKGGERGGAQCYTPPLAAAGHKHTD
ncbi:hypothetical protein FKM82_028925 [Ascaphus truei]